MVEGAAEYFTFFTAGELYNDPDPVSTMLKEAKNYDYPRPIRRRYGLGDGNSSGRVGTPNDRKR